MSWSLSTPIHTGQLDVGTYTYGEVKIVNMTHRSNQKLILVDLQYGNTMNGVWVPGQLPAGKAGSHTIQGQQYTDLVTTHVTINKELTYTAAKWALYDHLAAIGIIDAGNVT